MLNKISEEVIEIRLEGAGEVIEGYAAVNKAADKAAKEQESALKKQAATNADIQRKLTNARIANIKDRNKRELAFLKVRHVEEMKRARAHNANLKKLQKAQAQERSNLIQRQMQRDAETQRRANAAAAKAAERADAGLSKLQARLVTVGSAAQAFETGMRVASAAMRALSQPINLATTFEREFNLVRTLSDDVTDSTRQNLLDLASSVPQTQIEIARAAYNALSRQISEADLVGFLQTASAAATAGNVDLVTASDSLLRSLGAFSTRGESVNSVASKIFKTVKRASTNFVELNASIGQGLAVSSYGVKLEELLAIAGTLTATLGINFSEAIVRTNALMGVITGSTKKNQDAFKALGVDFGIATIQTKGLASILEDLRKATGGSAAALNEFSQNQRARQGLLGILEGTNYEVLKDFLTEISSETDGLGEALSKVQGDAASAQAQFRSLSESVLRDLGEAVLPHLNEVMQDLGDYLRTNRGEIVGTFKEVADAVVSLGRFLVENGDAIMTMVKGIFAFNVVNSFTGAVGGALGQLQKLGASGGASLTSNIARGMQALPGLGLIATAGLVIYDVVKENFFDKAAEDARRLQVDIAKTLDEAAKARGFRTRRDEVNRFSQVAEGRALGFGAANAQGILTLEEFMQRQDGDSFDAAEKLQAAVLADNAKRQERIDAIQGQIAGLLAGRERAREFGVRSDAFAEYDALLKRARSNVAALKKAQTELVNRADAVGEAAMSKQNFREAEALRTQNERNQEKSNRKTLAAAKRAAEARRREAERTAQANLALQRRFEDAQVAAIEDANVQKLIAQDLQHDREFQAAVKQGLDLKKLAEVQELEREQLQRQNRESRESASRARQAEQLSANVDMTLAKAIRRGDMDEQTGDFIRDEENQRIADEAEIERFKSLGLSIEELETEQLMRRKGRFDQFRAQRMRGEAQIVKSMASEIGGLLSNVKLLGQALGASESMVGKLEAMVLLSRAAFHTASGFGEIANSKSAFAGRAPLFIPNPAQGVAHAIAASSHFVAAAAAGVQAGVAASGGSTGGGGGAISAPAIPATAPRTGAFSAPLEAQEQRAAISFGDIHLSSIPSMLSREGASEMGKLIARDVAKELRQRANIQGTSRLPQRVIRRS